MSDQKPQNWYLRQNGKVTGPFPAGLVSRYILLGRIKFDDEVSPDREQWQMVKKVHVLIPDVVMAVLRDPSDEQAREHLVAARRWADERGEKGGAKSDNRKQEESEDELHHRNVIQSRERIRAREKRARQYLIAIALVVVVVVVTLLLPTTENIADAQCDALPAPHVNWSNCPMNGSRLANSNLEEAMLRNAILTGAVLRAANLVKADLAYADLSLTVLRGANFSAASLKGANLRNADLTNANLSNADLGYADLSGAILDGAVLEGAKFDYAVWGPELTCMPGSVGGCRLARKAR
jgi:uncharacterized protein YjbI with pentapeptide repeats